MESHRWRLGRRGQPQAGDSVYLTQSLSGGDLTLAYRNAVNPTAQLGALYIVGFGSGLLTLDQSSGDQLRTTKEYIGTVGRGAYNQVNGANLVSGELRLGYYSGSLGTYSLQGGSLASATETLGFSGAGAFTQSGGTNTVSGTLYFGNYAGASGTYALQGGSLSSNWQVIGNGGAGALSQSGGSLTANNQIFGMYGLGAATQTGGTATVNGSLYLGYYATGSGTYSLGGGSGSPVLSAQNEYLGYRGRGVFTQSGGTHTVTNSLTVASNIGSQGAYDLLGGSLSAAIVNLNAGGTFNQTGGTLNATSFNQMGGMVTGALENRGTFTYTSGAFSGRLLNYGTANLFAGGSAGFTAGDGLLQGATAAPLSIGAGKTLTLGGQGLTLEGSLTLAGNLNATDEIIGDYGTAAVFTQTGGSNTVSNYLTVGDQTGSSGTYNLQGGSLSASNQYIGDSGTGTFTQSGGTNTITGNVDSGVLYLGKAATGSGTYTLSNASLAARSEYVGDFGTGVFTQTDGTNTVSGSLYLGAGSGGSGTYTLSGSGSLSAANQYIGYYGSGAFAQSAGTNTVTGSGGLGVGYYAGSSGTYNQSGGSLSAVNQYIGYYGGGAFTQSAGTNTVSNTLTLAATSGSSGTYDLQGGSLAAATVNLNDGGVFNQTGGNLNYTTFNQSGGTVTGSLENRGTFNYSNGTFSGRLLNYGTANLGSSFAAGNGLMQAAGATTLNVGASQSLTLNGAGLDNQGTFTMSGGTLTGGGVLTNNATFSGYGTINANAGFYNNGAMTLTGGASTVNGTFYNQAGGYLNIIHDPANFTNIWNMAGATLKLTKVPGGDYSFFTHGTFTNDGAYISDPSTQYFNNLDVGSTGYLTGGAGDVFFVSGDFISRSSQNINWNTVAADLIFIKGDQTTHQLYLPGADLGKTMAGYAHNFAWGSLDLTGQSLTLMDGNDATLGGALYVGKIVGLLLNGSQVTNIYGNGLDIFYDPDLNTYLGKGIYSLEGGGYLEPAHTPLPGTVWLLLSGLAGLGLWRRKSWRPRG